MLRLVRCDLTKFIDKRLGQLDVTYGMSRYAGIQIEVDDDLMGEGYYWSEEMFE